MIRSPGWRGGGYTTPPKEPSLTLAGAPMSGEFIGFVTATYSAGVTRDSTEDGAPYAVPYGQARCFIEETRRARASGHSRQCTTLTADSLSDSDSRDSRRGDATQAGRLGTDRVVGDRARFFWTIRHASPRHRLLARGLLRARRMTVTETPLLLAKIPERAPKRKVGI